MFRSLAVVLRLIEATSKLGRFDGDWADAVMLANTVNPSTKRKADANASVRADNVVLLLPPRLHMCCCVIASLDPVREGTTTKRLRSS
jgi:hypothetical protein